MKSKLPRRGLYAITDTHTLTSERTLETTRLLLEAGVSLVQYRNKDPDSNSYRTLGEKLATLCQHFQVPLIVNDDPQLASDLGAAGVHLGYEDADILEVKCNHPELQIGVSCYNSLDRARKAVSQGANYVAFGSFFKSPTKPDAVCASDDLLTQAKACIDVPVVAIGGITPDNAPCLVEAGADLLAIISGLYGHPDPCHQAQKYLQSFNY